MAATLALWTPPAGMLPKVVSGWRTFYAKAMDSYEITPSDYRALYLAQAGRCFICRVAKGMHPDDPKGRGGRRLAIDHNHLVGNRREAVRGLLCSGSLSADTCNRLIAKYGPDALGRAHHYLTGPPAPRVFAALEADVLDANRIGIALDQWELDGLAQAVEGRHG